MIPGLVTSLVYFLGRDLYATIILHNFLGMTGVMQNVDLDRFSQPLYHLYILLIISVAVLIIADNFFIRRLRGTHKVSSPRMRTRPRAIFNFAPYLQRLIQRQKH